MNEERMNETYRMHAIRGTRLAKAMENKGIGQAELLRQAEAISKNYFAMSRQTLNQIIHGKRPLHYSDAELFSRILDVTPGYLMGSEESEETKRLLAWKKDAQKYNALLNQIHANIFGYSGGHNSSEETELESYGIVYRSQSANNESADTEVISVSVKDMESFYQDVCRFIDKRFGILKDLYKEEA